MRELLASNSSWSWYVGIAFAGVFVLGVVGVFLRFIYLQYYSPQQVTQVTTYNSQGQETQWQPQHPGGPQTYPYPYQQYPYPASPDGQVYYNYPPPPPDGYPPANASQWAAPAIGTPVVGTPVEAPNNTTPAAYVGSQPSASAASSSTQYPAVAPQGYQK